MSLEPFRGTFIHNAYTEPCINCSQVRWVLDQKAVGGAIVGVRLGYKEHIKDNRKTFAFTLDKDDLGAIAAVQSKSRDLMTVYGDCGQEYRN